MDLIKTRLSNQHLIGEKFEKVERVVGWFGAVQSQDFPAAKWALGIRIKNSTDQQVEQAFNEGKILRTHVMRPTWHFVMPADIRWMEALTAPRVKQFMSSYNRRLELTDELFAKTQKIIIKALSNKNYSTRQELKQKLEQEGIKTDVQRLAHIVSWAELDGIICSGPKRGKQFTYALLEERVPRSRTVGREEALAKLATYYFQSHGPAQLKDFSWWSGLSMKDAAEALSSIRSKLNEETIDGKIYWFFANKISDFTSPIVHLLSIFDEYTIAYKDRSSLSEEEKHIEKLLAMGNALTAVITLDGKIAGTWKREIKKDKIIVKPNFFRKLDESEQEAFEKAENDYAKFFGLQLI